MAQAAGLAPNTRSHIRSLMHTMFEAAQRWELIDLGKNPISLVRVKGRSKRAGRPQILTSEQFYDVLGFIPTKYRLMVLVAQCPGLRASEIIGLKWKDFDFGAGTVEILVYFGRRHGMGISEPGDRSPISSGGNPEALLETSGGKSGAWVFTGLAHLPHTYRAWLEILVPQ